MKLSMWGAAWCEFMKGDEGGVNRITRACRRTRGPACMSFNPMLGGLVLGLHGLLKFTAK